MLRSQVRQGASVGDALWSWVDDKGHTRVDSSTCEEINRMEETPSFGGVTPSASSSRHARLDEGFHTEHRHAAATASAGKRQRGQPIGRSESWRIRWATVATLDA